MAFFSVTTTIKADNGTNVVFVFLPSPSENIETIGDFADALEESGLVTGDRFRVTNGRRGEERVLLGRRETLLTREGVAMVTPYSEAENLRIIE